MKCPTEDTLLAVAEGRFADNASSIYGHFDSCPACRVLFNELARSYGEDDDEPRVGQSVGRYQLRARIGIGGMGVVFRAYDPELGRHIALKVLRPDMSTESHTPARLLREARAMAQLSHPNVVALYDVGVFRDHVFIAMELVSGATLRSRFDGEPSWRNVVSAYLQAARGLAAAHAAGLVHRDFKPENVLVGDDGRVRVADFGLVAMNPDDSFAATGLYGRVDLGPAFQTTSGLVLGTPAYMAPEAMRGGAVDARADQFSFCVALFHAVYQIFPYAGRTVVERAEQIAYGRIERPAGSAVPERLYEALVMGLSANPQDRHPSMDVLVRTIEDAIAPAPPGREAVIGIDHDVEKQRHDDRVTRVERPPHAGKPSAGGRVPRFRTFVLGATAFAVIASGIAAILGFRSGKPPVTTPVTMRERQVIAWTSGEQEARLSPDGRTLVVARDGRLVLQDIATGETRDLPPLTSQPRWVRWFPDGTRLLAGIASGPTRLDLVAIPVSGGAARTLPMHAWGAEVSHDGERIATFDENGIRVSRLDGSHAQLLIGTREEAEFGWPSWSPDDRWLAYSIRGPDLRPQIRAVATGEGNSDVKLVDDPTIIPPAGLPSYTWALDGRLLYNTYRGGPSALVAIGLDLATAAPRGSPIEIATYTDDSTVVNAGHNGRILFFRDAMSSTRYEAALGQGPMVPEPAGHQSWRRLGSARDGLTSVYLTKAGTNRTELLSVGRDGLPHVFASFEGTAIDPRLSPDDGSVLYLYVDATETLSLRRAALAGGAAAVVENLPYQPSVPAQFTKQLVAQLGCSQLSGRCVLGAMEGKEQVFYEVDPRRGRGRRLAALRGPPPWTWDLSPDGAKIVAAHREDAVRVLDLASGIVSDLVRDPVGVVYRIAWIGNTGAVLFATGQVRSTEIRRVDVSGRLTTVWSKTTGERLHDFDVHENGTAIEFETIAWSRSFWLLERGE